MIYMFRQVKTYISLPLFIHTKYLWAPTYKNGIWLTNVASSKRLQWNNDADCFRLGLVTAKSDISSW